LPEHIKAAIKALIETHIMPKDTEKQTAVRKQYQRFKDKYMDCILFFRMGDFYESFYEDAEICSRVCGLALNSRSKGNEFIPLASVPYLAANGYFKKLRQSFYKVAVCEQIEGPRTAKGTVKRDMVRILTPGSLSDSTKEGPVL